MALRVELGGHIMEFDTAAGLFSPAHADRGTLAMLACADLAPGQRVLDLGCGWGLAGVYAALVCGAEAVKDRNYFEESISRIIATRERAKEELKKLGFVFTDSRANFLFAKHPDYDGGQLFEELKAQKIYVRHWPGERLGQYLRITVGTDEEMDRLFDFLRKKIR